ncbi:ABC transporter ATP-binding protein [Planctobacterium marinum]|uniref:ABC transporter permease n=1 Tax=Planctobacterium marinum TaxID=1631968 RepID=A0AA48HTD1_9ALTE|nr:ABC transporter permease [Planctobacterium marinum]
MIRKYLAFIANIVGKDTLFAATGLFALGFMEGVSLMLIIPLLATIGVTEQQVTSHPITLKLTQFADAIGLPLNIFTVLLAFIVLIAIRELLIKRQTIHNNAIQQKIVNAFRLELYKALIYSNWLLFTKIRHSDMTQALTQDINRIGLMVLISIRMASTIVIASVYLIGSFIVSFEMTLLTFLSVVLLLWFGRKKLNDAYRFGGIHTSHHDKMYSLISESLTGIKTAKCFSSENRQVADFASNIDAIYEVQSQTCASRANAKFMFGLGTAIILASFLFIAVEMLQLSIISILVLVFLFSRLSPKVSLLQQDLLRLINTLPALSSFDQLLTQAQACFEQNGKETKLVAPERQITLENICFSYIPIDNATTVKTLTDVQLTIPVGQIIGIIGPSGSGKSTLADILMGLIAPQSGEIRIDGNKLKEEQLLQWRRHISYVPQETHLFHDSVRNNLLWSKPDATEAQLLTALKQANALDFVMALPQGLDTSVGEKGIGLSGGQRQRLALARALLPDPTLLILDEATSALDDENQSTIMKVINQLKGKLTTVIITHHLSSLRDVDRIYIMKNGQIEDYLSSEITEKNFLT